MNLPRHRLVLSSCLVAGLATAPTLGQHFVYDAGTAGNPAIPTSPVQQGWQLRTFGSVGLNPIADDGGLNAWGISDVSPPGSFDYGYYYENNPPITNNVIREKWELTVTMKPTAGPQANLFIEVNSGYLIIHTGYRVFFRIAGDDVIAEDAYGTALGTCAQAADGEYHTFSIRKVNTILYGDVEVLYDGDVIATMGEDWPGSYAFDLGAKFGTWADYGQARARFHRVEFRMLDDLGVPRCSPAVPNSTGQPGRLTASGSPYVNQNLLELSAASLPTNALGYFIASRTPGFLAMPAGSQGNVCMGGAIGRFLQQAQSSGTAGEISVSIDLTSIPGNPGTAVLPGDTWIFQLWHRDANPTSTSNFTHALDVAFR